MYIIFFTTTKLKRNRLRIVHCVDGEYRKKSYTIRAIDYLYLQICIKHTYIKLYN